VTGTLTVEGRLLLHPQQPAFRKPAVMHFLQRLLRQIPGPLVVIGEGAPIHRARVVQDSLALGAAERLQLVPFHG
jgi:hypothetical protein